ncbi:MAG TPA: type I secretion C-terminal target domain-containing protein [Stellaceae bacterium]|nr:type I secretion C-terminal target domain-containing protein [Stellaceae bacterium]
MTVGIDLTGGGSVLAWQTTDGIFFERYDANLDPVGSPIEVAASAATWVSAQPLDNGGFTVFWDTSATSPAAAQDYDANGAPVGATYSVATPSIAATASTSRDLPTGPQDVWTTILPNGDTVTVTNSNGGNGNAPSLTMQQYDPADDAVGPAYVHSVPGLPGLSHVETAALADGGYVVSFVDESNFGAVSFVDLFGADGTHRVGEQVTQTGYQLIGSQEVASLPDSGFVVSWTAAEYVATSSQPPAPYAIFSEEFDQNGGAVTPARTVTVLPDNNFTQPQIDVFANGKYTISWTSDGTPQSASFVEQGTALPGQTNDEILTPALVYTAPLGPHDITLVSTEAQTVTGNSLGDTITSNDAASTLIGGSGNDTLIAGHGANTLTGNGGADTFVFNDQPWSAGQITDFTPGTDKIDLTALLHAAGYTGSDPVADGYVTFVDDGQGDTSVYFNPHSASQTWPTLITTVDHVAPSALSVGDLVGYSDSSSAGGGDTGGGSGSGTGTGTAGGTLTANDTAGQQLTGTPDNDIFYAGHNSVVMTGDGGADSFVFQAVPWNAGQITDFTPGTDKIDLSALLSAAGYTGSDPVADGWVTFASDGHGDTQVFFDAHDPSNPWPSLITTLDNLAPTGLTAANVLGDSGTATSGGDSFGGGAPPGSSVEISDATYTAPAGVTNIVLTGSAAQTVIANNLGDTITSNDHGSTITGGSGNDSLIAGHSADMLTGGGGSDSFIFNALPWNAGHITDFDPSTDTLDLHGIFAGIGYAGSDPVADGYLNFVADGSSNTKVYVEPQGPSTTIPILVTTLDHVLQSALHQGDYLFT